MNKDQINKRLADLLKKADTNSDKLLAEFEKELLKVYRQSLEEIKKLIAKIYEKYGDTVDYADMVSYNRLTNLEQQIAGEIKKLTNKNIKTTTSTLKNIYSEQFYRSGFAFEQSLGAKLGFGLLNPDVIKASVLNPLDRITWPDRMKDHAQQFVKQIQTELTQGLIQGEGYGKIAKRIVDKTGINAGKVIRIVRTEGHRVQSAGSLLAYDKTQTAADRLGLKTVKVWIATLDNRTRDSHQKMDGKEANDEGIFTLPSGATTEAPGLSGVAEEDINCFLGSSLVHSPSNILGLTKRFYEGELIRITTVGGIKLTGTPNHPILTPQGWIPLNLLNEGSDILSAFFSDEMVSTNPNINDAPIIFSDIFNFSNIIGSAKRFSGIKKDFHGDGFNSDVNIISTKSFLKNTLNPKFIKPFRKYNLFFTKFRKRPFFGQSFFMKLFFACWFASSSSISFFNKLYSFIKRSLPHPDKHRLASTPNANLCLSENSVDNLSADFKIQREFFNRRSIEIQIDNISLIERIIFSGHIYNLENDENYYLITDANIKDKKTNSNYIIVHNCRCTTIMQFKDFPPAFRKDNETKGIIKYQNYEEWKKAKGIG